MKPEGIANRRPLPYKSDDMNTYAGQVKMIWMAAAFVLLCGATLSAAELHSIGVSVADLGNPFFVRIARCIADKARMLEGDQVEVLVRSSAYDMRRQQGQIDEFIQRKVDLIILTAADSNLIERDVKRAQAAGIKVIAVDINAAGADVTITTNNYQAGEIACQYLAQKMNGTGNLVIINGASISSVNDRVAGCKAMLSRYPGIRLLSDELNGGGSIEGGMEAMTHSISAYDHIDGVFAINDPSAQGVVLAAEQADRKDFFVASVDGAPSAQQALADSHGIWVASAAQFPCQMAEKAVELGLELLQGQPVKQKVILIPARLITVENHAEYNGWAFKAGH